MKRIKSVVAFLGASGLPVATAKALEVEIFLAFAVLLVGGVFVLGLYNMTKGIKPGTVDDPGNQGTIEGGWIIPYHTNVWDDYHLQLFGYMAATAAATPNVEVRPAVQPATKTGNTDFVPNSNNGFTIQCGVSPRLSEIQEIYPHPWALVGSNLPPVVNDHVLVNIPGQQYTFTTTSCGSTWLYSTTNLTPDEDEYGLIPSTGDISKSVATNLFYTEAVERTVDFVIWIPLATNNAIDFSTVWTFVDTDPPPQRGFYRIRLQ